jgi:hypothetical protein
MDLKQAVVTTLGSADFIVNAYLGDLTPQEMMSRPCPGANHIAWQLGHLISSERFMMDKAMPGKMDALPAGFDVQHKKDKCGSDGPGFLSKEEYIKLGKQVRANTIRVVQEASAADYDRPVTGVPPFLKTVGEVFLFIGTHWTMHAGQWAIIRRNCGKPPLF